LEKDTIFLAMDQELGNFLANNSFKVDNLMEHEELLRGLY
jgi:hypothetical protein